MSIPSTPAAKHRGNYKRHGRPDRDSWPRRPCHPESVSYSSRDANSIQIRIKADPTVSRRHRQHHHGHRDWRPVVIAILLPLSSVVVSGLVFYLVTQFKPQIAATTTTVNRPAVVSSTRESSTSLISGVSQADSTRTLAAATTEPRLESRVLVAVGEDVSTVLSDPERWEDNTGSRTRQGPNSTAVVASPATSITAKSSPTGEHWVAFDARWHAGLYESSRDIHEQNVIDHLVFDDLRQQSVEPAKLCSDETFFRRVYLDVLGTLPSADEARAFIDNHAASKRNDLIEHVLEQPEFADYWAMKWSDVLRVKAEFPINLWPQAAQAYHHWIRTAIANNMPYDQFARELLTASGSNFRTPQVNFYRALQSHEPKAIAQVVALTFMGERAENWPTTRLDSMSQFFSRVGYKPTGEWKEEIVYFDRRRDGKVSIEPVRASYPGGVVIEIPASEDPRRVFADWLTDDRNAWFSRVAVNRVWSWLVGRGIVEPVDDIRIGNRPSNPKLLDHLAKELIESRYNMKHVIRVILQSDAYQQSCIPASKDAHAAEHFAFYQTRRLDAEVLIDAICQITGTTETYMSIIPEPFTFLPETQRAIALPDGSITSSFLETFGRPSRDTGLASERNNQLTAGQALHLLNSNHIRDKIRRGRGIKELLRESRDQFETVDLLYLTILSRRPTEGELTIGGPLCRSNSGAQDLAWALINSDEFLFRH